MPEDMPPQTSLRVADLPQNRATRFNMVPDATQRDRVADDLGILGIRKLTFAGAIAAEGKNDWKLTADLGATVEQACVVTLEPVVTRIDLSVTRKFVADLETGLEEEVEMPDDDSQEPLGAEIDLLRVMSEALALALPDYPRRDDASLENTAFSAPGVAPMTDEDTKPFAGLAGLKDKLEKGE